MSPGRRAFALILDLLRRRLTGGAAAAEGRPPPDATEGIWTEAVRLAAAQRVAPALGAAVADLGVRVPGEAGAVLAFLRERNAERNRALRAALLETVGELNRIGVEPVLLKGGLRLLDGLYPDPSWRFLGDLDLLVPPGRAGEAHARLLELGYAPLDGELAVPADHHHSAPLVHPRVRAAVEVHHGLLLPPFDRVLPPAAVLDGAARVEVEGARLRLPRPEHQLVHLVAHAQLHHERHLAAGLAVRDLLEARLLLRRDPSSAAALGKAFASQGWGRVADTYAALLDRHLPDGSPPAGPRTPGVDLLLAWTELNLRSPRAAAAGELIGFYRARVARLRASAAARARLLRGLADEDYRRRRGAELARLWRGLAGRAGPA